MAVYDNIHSRLVFWLKIVLPLMALAILATLFLFSRRIEVDGVLPYADVDVNELVREQRLTAPEYASVTSDGAALRISAATAHPEAEDGAATARDLTATIETADGLRIDVSATEGRIDFAERRLILTQDVEMMTSSGYRISATQLESSLDRTNIRSDEAISAIAPYGQVNAGAMELRLNDAENSGYLLVFKKGVRLIYEP